MHHRTQDILLKVSWGPIYIFDKENGVEEVEYNDIHYYDEDWLVETTESIDEVFGDLLILSRQQNGESHIALRVNLTLAKVT